MLKEKISTCIYCGCGCKLKYLVNKGKIVKVLPVNEPVSRGKPCIKGLTIHEIVDKNRIKKPLIRDSKNKDFEEVSWEYALEYIKNKLESFSEDKIMFVASGETTNEDNYVMQKFARIVCQTNNIDNCARLCHAPTIFTYQKMFGNSANPHYLDDIFGLDLLLLAGTNPFSNYPVVFSRILEAKNKGLKVIYLHHIDDVFSNIYDMKIIVNPGTELVVLMYWIKYLLDSGIRPKIDGIDALINSIENISLDFVSNVTGAPKELIEKSAELLLNSENFGFMHGMGLTQQPEGTENIMALVALSFLKNGKILSLRGKVNVQGAGDMLAHPWLSFSTLEMLEKTWNHKVPKFRGKSLIEAVFLNPVKFMWISSMNPAVSLPDLNRVHNTFRKMFIVVSHYVWNLTCEFANIILPTPLLIEREGTITTGERRIRYVERVRFFENTKQEWEIFKDLARMFGKEKWFNYKNSREIFEEIVRVIPSYRKVDPRKLYENKEDDFADKEMKYKLLVPIDIEGIGFKKLKDYNFLLTSTRCPYHFVSGDLTRNSDTLKKLGKGPYLIINPQDASRLGIKENDEVIVESEVSSLKIKIKISNIAKPGTVVSSFHFESFLFNKLVPLEYDYETHIPNYKIIPVKIKKVSL